MEEWIGYAIFFMLLIGAVALIWVSSDDDFDEY